MQNCVICATKCDETNVFLGNYDKPNKPGFLCVFFFIFICWGGIQKCPKIGLIMSSPSTDACRPLISANPSFIPIKKTIICLFVSFMSTCRRYSPVVFLRLSIWSEQGLNMAELWRMSEVEGEMSFSSFLFYF